MRRPGDGKKAGSRKAQDNPDDEEVTPAAKRKCTKPRDTPPPEDKLEAKENLERALKMMTPASAT